MKNIKSIIILYILAGLLLSLIIVFPVYFLKDKGLNFDVIYSCVDNTELFIYRNSNCNFLKVSSQIPGSRINKIPTSKINNGKVRKEIKRLIGRRNNYSLMQVYPLNNQDLTRDIGHLLIFDDNFVFSNDLDYAIVCVKKLSQYKNGILPSRIHAVYEVYSLQYVDETYFEIGN